ncbi:uncharacterized protein LOC143214906 isoform X2 [Lasioglossum baleicum]|uniref:uncharacterized protein LOC143214906 isoform X2 n=1 Tax=Lasioglossum baleicum TaxID=434251 RepID=UPI003FCE8322
MSEKRPEMSEIQTLTDSTDSMDLPKEMDQNFVSAPEDYDYPFYISEKEEWVNYKNTKGRTIVCEPMLIMELNRLVPFVDNNYIGFHVLNMPHIIIKKIEIIGFVVAVSENARFYMYQVDDGTGTIMINYDRKHFMRDSLERKAIDEKYKCNAKKINSQCFKGQECPKRFPDPRPQFNYPVGTSNRDMAVNKWIALIMYMQWVIVRLTLDLVQDHAKRSLLKTCRLLN